MFKALGEIVDGKEVVVEPFSVPLGNNDDGLRGCHLQA